MKPRIGTEVYVIYTAGLIPSIFKEKVFMLGKEAFLCECVLDSCLQDDYRTQQYYFDAYNRTWFTSLSAAKQVLIKRQEICRPNFTVKIHKMQDDVWSAFYERRAE